MAAGDQPFFNFIFRGAEKSFSIEDLLLGGDVVGLACDQEYRAFDILQAQASPQSNEFALRKLVFLEKRADDVRYQRPGRSMGFSYQLSKVSSLAR